LEIPVFQEKILLRLKLPGYLNNYRKTYILLCGVVFNLIAVAVSARRKPIPVNGQGISAV